MNPYPAPPAEDVPHIKPETLTVSSVGDDVSFIFFDNNTVTINGTEFTAPGLGAAITVTPDMMENEIPLRDMKTGEKLDNTFTLGSLIQVLNSFYMELKDRQEDASMPDENQIELEQ